VSGDLILKQLANLALLMRSRHCISDERTCCSAITEIQQQRQENAKLRAELSALRQTAPYRVEQHEQPEVKQGEWRVVE
jgi:hypothetical protein